MTANIELWAGPECTLNRVGDSFTSQIAATGLWRRAEDLDQLIGLNVRAMRYPILWEQVAPDLPDMRDWAWTDARLTRLSGLGIRPIAGLVHHGSGPRYTDLLDDGFAAGLADHARAVAERYPWITDWTPINEPLTTARFSALYGLWYPHHRDERSFWTALINQIDGVRLAMAEIRRIIPHARLIQTDDLGRTYATATLKEQAAFDNSRRWMGWDLLCGRVTPRHDLWRRLCELGLEARLRAIAEAPCPPDIIGINHYPTSDRFLDHRVQRYPRHARGGNGRIAYADIEAVRVIDPPSPGIAGALQEAWARYAIPIAITEVHNGCTREEQMRWLIEAWDAAHAAQLQGIGMTAVTAWALYGSIGWDRLLTGGGRYESGVFDVRRGAARPTALAGLMARIGDGEAMPHPAMAGDAWWRRTNRFDHARVPRAAPMRQHRRASDWTRPATAPLLITGATGTLGRALAAACERRNIACVTTTRDTIDLANPASMADALDRLRPWAVINAAGWVRVDDAEDDPAACHAANATGPIALAQACAARGIATVHISSVLVFDGVGACDDAAPRRPLNAYGRSKAALEDGLADLPGDHLIIRTAALFSAGDAHNFAHHVATALQAGEPFDAVDDHVVSPTYVPHLCDAMLDLTIDGAAGIWHLSHGEGLSWAQFARRIARACGLDEGDVRPIDGAEAGWRAARPRDSTLMCRGAMLPPLEEAIHAFAHAWQAASAPARNNGPSAGISAGTSGRR